jgi:hypothetical protein
MIETLDCSCIAAKYRQLFLDDVMIDKKAGLTRNMHQLTRFSDSAVFPYPDPKPWERGGVYLRAAPQWIPEDKVYKIWYQCYEWTDPTNPSYEKRFSPVQYAMAVSGDGINWERPELGIVSYDGINTNLVNHGSTGGPWTSGVIYDPIDPDPKRRYKDLVWAPTAFGSYWEAFGWYPIYSSDGIVWSDAVKEEKIENHDDAFTIYNEIDNCFLMPGKIWRADGNKMNDKNPRDWGIRRSYDFKNWTKGLNVVFAADEIDQFMGRERIKEAFNDPDRLHPVVNKPDEYMTDVYEFPVFPYEGIYIGIPSIFDRTGELEYENQAGLHHLQLTSSRNLTDWIRLGERKEFLQHSSKTMFDSGMHFSTSRILNMGNELWYYYVGAPRAHDTGESRVSKEEQGIGLAKLRRDGFVSLDAGKESGWLTTVPYMLKNNELFVNTDARNGYVKAALKGINGDTLPGCGFEDMIALTGDLLAGKVIWRGSENLISNKKIQIMFEVNNAKIYSFWE